MIDVKSYQIQMCHLEAAKKEHNFSRFSLRVSSWHVTCVDCQVRGIVRTEGRKEGREQEGIDNLLVHGFEIIRILFSHYQIALY